VLLRRPMMEKDKLRIKLKVKLKVKLRVKLRIRSMEDLF